MGIKVGIHINRFGKIGPFAKKYINILQYNNIDYVILDINQIGFWEKLKECTHFIFHWGGNPDQNQVAKSIMPVIESHTGIRVFPNQRTTWHHDDKIRQFYLLKNLGYPIIDSWVFWEKRPAIKWLKEQAHYPLIFKLISSAGSKDVVMVKSFALAKRITNKMFGSGIKLGKVPGNLKIKILDFKWSKIVDQILKKGNRLLRGRDINYQWKREKNYVLFQKYLHNNNFDTRITIIGDRAFAFRRFNRSNDFRSSGSGKIDYDTTKINKAFIKLAFKVSTEMNFQSMAYDFLWDEKEGIKICEISYTYQDLAIYNCSGYWDSDLVWHEGHYWPQYFHLIDLLGINHLTQSKL